jgi:hypothetical protein
MGVRERFFSNSSIREDPMTYAIVNKPELAVVSMSDHRTDSERFLDFAKEAGIGDNDPSLVRLLKALEATEKWQAGTMTEYLEIAFIEFELEAAFKEFGEAHENKWLSGLPRVGLRVLGFNDSPRTDEGRFIPG